MVHGAEGVVSARSMAAGISEHSKSTLHSNRALNNFMKAINPKHAGCVNVIKDGDYRGLPQG